MSLTADVAKLMQHLFKQEQGSEHQPGLFPASELAGELGWTPVRFNLAFRVLESRGYVAVDPSMGSAPFDTHALRLNEQGLLLCEGAAAEAEEKERDVGTTVVADPKKVFVIHGRNRAARVAVDHFLKALGLQPIEFDQLAAGMGSEFVGNIVVAGMKQAQGIVALFTPDEFSSLHPLCRYDGSDKDTEIRRWQARPNVIFEAGIAFGFARERTILVTMGSEVSLFSDVAGIHLLRLSNSTGSRSAFRSKLIGAGCAVDERTSAWTNIEESGDFEACLTAPPQALRDPFAATEPVPAAQPAPADDPVATQQAIDDRHVLAIFKKYKRGVGEYIQLNAFQGEVRRMPPPIRMRIDAIIASMLARELMSKQGSAFALTATGSKLLWGS